METTKVYYYSDGMYSREIERKSVKCPFCGVINIPEYLFLKNVERSDFSMYLLNALTRHVGTCS